jgi:hypothetical protein
LADDRVDDRSAPAARLKAPDHGVREALGGKCGHGTGTSEFDKSAPHDRRGWQVSQGSRDRASGTPVGFRIACRAATHTIAAVEAFADAGAWNLVIKEVTARVRLGQQNAGRFSQYGSTQNQSFPSGHAMTAFSVAYGAASLISRRVAFIDGIRPVDDPARRYVGVSWSRRW